MTGGLRPELAAPVQRFHNGAMEHGIVYPALLFVTLMSPVIWNYRRNRTMYRVQRGLRSYLRTA